MCGSSNPSYKIACAHTPCMSSHMFKSFYIGLQLCEGGKPCKELVLVVTTEVQTIETECYRKYIISVCVFYFSARPYRKIFPHPRFHNELRRCHIVCKFAMLCSLGNREGRIYLCMLNNRHRFSEYVKFTVA